MPNCISQEYTNAQFHFVDCEQVVAKFGKSGGQFQKVGVFLPQNVFQKIYFSMIFWGIVPSLIDFLWETQSIYNLMAKNEIFLVPSWPLVLLPFKCSQKFNVFIFSYKNARFKKNYTSTNNWVVYAYKFGLFTKVILFKIPFANFFV